MKVAVIGGGASGITAAILIKRYLPNTYVTVFEKGERILRKIPATGNGRCNLSNTDISAKKYISENTNALNHILSAFSAERVKLFFESLGVLLCEEHGRIYPMSFRAGSVADALRFSAESYGVRVLLNTRIKDISTHKNGFICNGEYFDNVIISFGGAAAPSFGTDGSSYTVLKKLGHTVTPVRCALVPICVKENTKKLKGVRSRAEVSVKRNGKVLFAERGELQFTDYGLSGICVMQLSALLKANDTLLVDFCFDYSFDAIFNIMKSRRARLSYLSCVDFLSGLVHKAVAADILSRLGIYQTESAASLTDVFLKKICTLLKALPFTFEKTLDFKYAQATLGGAPLCEFNPATLESLKCPGLYCIGEALEPVGLCGGYNLHFAWATAHIAAQAIAHNNL